MPTTDERREVAARLRELYPDDVLPPSSQVRIDICYTIGCGFGQEHQGEKIHKRLADLIEPEERTCRMEIDWDYDGDCPAYYRDYVCSECKEDFIYYKSSRVSFCPSCGARVKEEA